MNHPAAKMIALAAKMQESEAGDGTNLVVVLAGELMQQAENLLKMGLHPSEILIGYEKAGKKCLEMLDGLVSYQVENLKDTAELTKCIKSVIASKHYGNEHILAPLVAEASQFAMSTNGKYLNVENVRVQKLLGGSLSSSTVIHGMAIMRSSETTIRHVKNANIAIFNTPLETEMGDTHGTVLLRTAEELMNYTKTEEANMEKFVQSLAQAGVNCAITSGGIADIALHFFEKYKIMLLKVLSKFECKRIAKATGGGLVVKHVCPTPEEMGHAAEVQVEEISSAKITVFRRNEEDNHISTILLRGSTYSMLDDAERAIDDAVNTIKNLTKDSRLCAGAGATEIHMASQIQTFAKTQPGLDQYAVEKFGQSFEIIARTLAENAGFNAEEVIAKLYSETAKSPFFGIDVEDGKVKDMKEQEIYDSIETKSWAIKLAMDAVLTILKVDQIIMSKPAGGPKPRDNPLDPDVF